MKLYAGFGIFLLALLISGVAAYFSVVGLAAIFSATFMAVVIMGAVLEAGKIAAAGWLHTYWGSPKVSRFHKGYMVGAVGALMLITSLGIYGFLAKGHLEQAVPLAPVQLEIAQKTERLTQLDAELAAQAARINQLDNAVNSMIGGDQADKALRYRSQQRAERLDVQKRIEAANAEKGTIATSLVPLKLQVSGVEAKLGPIQYVADLFGLKDTEGAVRLVILIIMFAFDPLAIVLVISSLITIGEGLSERRDSAFLKRTRGALGSEHVINDETEMDEFPENLIPLTDAEKSILDELETENLLVELEEHIAQETSDKEQLLALLAKSPELLQEVIDAVKESEQTQADEVKQDPSGWFWPAK